MNKEILKSQPIIDWLMYPACKRVVWSDYENGRQIIKGLESLRGRLKRPVYITQSFEQCAARSAKSFESMFPQIIKENNGEWGVIVFAHDCDQDTANCTLFSIVGNRLAFSYFSCSRGFNMSNLVFCAFVDFKEDSYHMEIGDYFDLDMEYERTLANLAWTGIVLYLALRKYAKVEVKDLKHGKKVVHNGTEYTSTSNVPFEIFDSKWFTEICSDKDFSVRGHFRLQPKKVNGEWTKELIYINEFMKHGYHRKALIEKVKEEQIA